MKMTALPLLFSLVLLVNDNALGSENEKQTCKSADYIQASYSITEKPTGQAQQKYVTRLFRSPTQVALQRDDKKITELWEPVTNSRLHLVRYFDDYQRGIEYHPQEIKGEQDWSQKQNFISDHLRNKMSLIKSKGTHCNKVEWLEYQNGDTKIKMQWLVNLQLPKTFSVRSPRENIKWRLEEFTQDKFRVSERFAQLSGYQTTDYIDIGDSESDPFLSKMIYLGFVEHGHSGVYDASGHAIDHQNH